MIFVYVFDVLNTYNRFVEIIKDIDMSQIESGENEANVSSHNCAVGLCVNVRIMTIKKYLG